MIKVMYVCLGNICRSPAAEATLRRLAEKGGIGEQLEVDSCGLGAWHIGRQADQRMRSAAQTRGLAMVGRAKQIQNHYLETYDYIFAADQEVLSELLQMAGTPEYKAKIHLMTAFSSAFQGLEVPDPYYKGSSAFEDVLDILEDSCEGFIEHLKKERKV